MKTITDHKWKQFKYRDEVPKGVLSNELDWCEPEDEYLDGFICYRRSWYHLGEFMQTEMSDWDGYHGNSYFSGVAIKLSITGEEYKIATLLS